VCSSHLSYPGHILELATGVEPVTFRLRIGCSKAN
jgi:hypothetical protein